MSEQDQLIDQFISVTNSSKYLAEQYLSRNKNDLVDAIEDYYANNKPSASTEEGDDLKIKRGSSSRGVKTFRDLNKEDEDDDDDKTNTNFFTGGEKSGLQVEDPTNRDKKNEQSIIDQIFQRAREQMDQPDTRPSANDEDEPLGPRFTGTGFQLGDGTGPSAPVVDPTSAIPQRPSKVTREITFWKQGFTVGEGPLHRYDDPSNESVLQELNRGRVPMSLLDVEFGQDVDVSVFKKTDEDWKPPRRKIGGFHGQGQRLGSPVPGEVLSNSSSSANLVESPLKEETVVKPPSDEGEGDSLVQIRFANGKRVSRKFSSSDSIKTVYDFVRSHPFNELHKPFALSHSFPVKPIEESEETTVESAKLKNAVIVQRWI